MEFTEEQYFQAFGVEDDRDSTPAEYDNQDDMSKNAEETPEDVHEEQTVDAQPPEGTEGATKGSKQSRSQNARYAAARRAAESERDQAIQDMEAKIAEAREQGRQEGRQDILNRAKLENPYTNETISSTDQFDAWEAERREQEQQRRLRDMDMTPEQYDEFISDLPEVREARQLAEQQKQQQFKARLDAEVSEISKMNPAIQTIDDLKADPKYGEITDKLRAYPNMTLDDAYKLVHMDDLVSNRGRQQAINARGKSHMTATHGRSESSVSVPSDELAMFRALCPEASDDQISKFYNSQIQLE